MDNKQNRQFYWEVKDFMNKKHEAKPASKPVTSVVDSVKNVLKENNLYKPSSFNNNINSVSAIRQAIDAMESSKKAGNPNSPAFTKNVYKNAFGMLKEATAFDTVTSNVAKLASSAAFGSLGQSTRALNIMPVAGSGQFSNSMQSAQIPGQSSLPRSHQLPDGTWVDDQGNPIPGSPGYQPPQQTSGANNQTTSTNAMQKQAAQQSPEDRREDLIQNVQKAGAMPSPIAVSGQDRAAAAQARNQAIASANIAAGSERAKLRSELRKAMDAAKASREAEKAARVDVEGPPAPGQGQPQSFDANKVAQAEKDAAAVREKMDQLRDFNDRTGFNRSNEMGDKRFSQSSIATRYAQKPRQMKTDASSGGYRGDPNLTDLSKPLPPNMQATVDELSKNPKQNSKKSL